MSWLYNRSYSYFDFHALPGFANTTDVHSTIEGCSMLLSGRAFESSAVSIPPFRFSAPPAVLHDAPDPETRLKSPSASAWTLSWSRRLVDLSVALLVLALLGIPMLAIALCVRLSSPGPALFAQYRVGRAGRLFRIYKFRTMSSGAEGSGPGLTREGDGRITVMGRWMRKLKLDEFPQFYNVLRGDMSLVGPRPKLPRYFGIANMPYRPGITGTASLAFRREEQILSRVPPGQMDDFYNRHIRPLKARIDARYMCRATFWSDMRLIGATFLACLPSTPAHAVVPRSSTRILAFPTLPAQESNTAEFFGAVL